MRVLNNKTFYYSIVDWPTRYDVSKLPDPFTTKQAFDILGMNKTCVYRACQKGYVKKVKEEIIRVPVLGSAGWHRSKYVDLQGLNPITGLP
jgi:hypothetical protein